jgi:ADP-dependent NAD(P)H-hydrate dehydratase / NAD(P)H-hydrate epimerase
MILPLSWEDLRPLLVPRQRDSHKGDYGHVLVVGGDAGFGGAALLAGEAALRCGAGLCSVATHPAHATAFLTKRPELMVKAIAGGSSLLPLLERATVLVLGPGLGQSAWSLACFQAVLPRAIELGLPIVLDADGLNLLAQGELQNIQASYEQWLLTPHPGEAARLLGITREQVQAERESACRQLQQRYGGAVILKGVGSLVATVQQGQQSQPMQQPIPRPIQRVEQCQHGNPGMASGGMGDVLSGVCGALLAQGFGLQNSARLAMCLHSKAADLAAGGGERGLLASDLFPFLRGLLNPGLDGQ